MTNLPIQRKLTGHRGLLWCALMLLLAGFTGTQTAGAETAPESITMAHVHSRLRVLNHQIDTLRQFMGKPKIDRTELQVSGAASREVYFQARSMLDNAQRLRFELTHEKAASTAQLTEGIAPADVYHTVDAAIDCIDRVLVHLGVEASPTDELPMEYHADPSDVFCEVVQINRQLNMLLERQVAPSDVFEKVTLGVGYTSRILASFPGATTIPESPEFEPGKYPSDVYARLLECQQRLKRVADISGLQVLQVDVAREQVATAVPNDVHQLASLVVSELAYVHSQIPAAQPPRPVYYVGRKFPSHVYQRAGLLERQLIELEALVRKHPNWLANGAEE